MKNKQAVSNAIENAIEAAFVADTYCLGAHWMYDGKELGALDINWEELNAPRAHWHKTKQKGEFTHYGDHGKWLYDFVQEHEEFRIETYRDFWMKKMQDYTGYIDASSRETVAAISENPAARKGSDSTELSIIGRIAPLLLVSSNRQEFLAQVNDLVAFTHNSPRVLKAAELFASILFDVVNGKSIGDAISDAEVDPVLQEAFDAALASQGQDSFRTIRKFGPACGIEGAFEGVLYLLCSYDDYKQALVANARAGGDSAARGMVVGMIMGAAGKEVPISWREGMSGF